MCMQDMHVHAQFFNCSISDDRVGSVDRSGYILNFESSIDFAVDDEFMFLLEDEFGVDTNPRDDDVQFTLNCEVDQGDGMVVQTVPVVFKVCHDMCSIISALMHL